MIVIQNQPIKLVTPLFNEAQSLEDFGTFLKKSHLDSPVTQRFTGREVLQWERSEIGEESEPKFMERRVH